MEVVGACIPEVSCYKEGMYVLSQFWRACRAKLWEPNLKRWHGFYDHHLLHYLVTTACLLHIAYIRAATRRTEHTATV